MANEKTELVAGSTGNRYNDDKKKEILEFFWSKNGERGATSETLKKFNISYIALRSWLKKYGSDSKPTKKANKTSGKVSITPKGDVKRGRKANPSIFALRLLMKMQKTNAREGKQIEKAIAKISV